MREIRREGSAFFARYGAVFNIYMAKIFDIIERNKKRGDGGDAFYEDERRGQ